MEVNMEAESNIARSIYDMGQWLNRRANLEYLEQSTSYKRRIRLWVKAPLSRREALITAMIERRDRQLGITRYENGKPRRYKEILVCWKLDFYHCVKEIRHTLHL